MFRISHLAAQSVTQDTTALSKATTQGKYGNSSGGSSPPPDPAGGGSSPAGSSGGEPPPPPAAAAAAYRGEERVEESNKTTKLSLEGVDVASVVIIKYVVHTLFFSLLRALCLSLSPVGRIPCDALLPGLIPPRRAASH